MIVAVRLYVAAVVLASIACDGSRTGPQPPSPNPPEPPPAPPTDGITVNGTERLGWNQGLPAGVGIGSVQFNAYVDGVRTAMADVACTAQSATHYECAAALPQMSNGRHELRMTSVRSMNGRPVESTKSTALVVVKVSSAAATSDARSRERPAAAAIARGSPSRFTSTILAEGVAAIADLAVAPDGRVFAAERRGRILAIDPVSERSRITAALQLDELETSGNRGLFSLALHPDFISNGLIYFVYAAVARDGPVYRLARGREVGGRIGEMAVLLDAAPAPAESWAVIRFGPDGLLYAALGEDPDSPAAAASYGGKLLRLNGDGTPAADSATGSPVVAGIPGVPSGLAWTEDSRVVQFASGEHHEIRARGPSGAAAQVWETGRRPAAIVYYPPGPHGSRRGQLLAATLDSGIQRLPWPSPSPRVRPAIDAGLAREYGAVRALAAAPDGSLYIGTANADVNPAATASTPDDVIVRLTPRVRDRP